MTQLLDKEVKHLRDALLPEDSLAEQRRLAKKQKAKDQFGTAWAFDGVYVEYRYTDSSQVYTYKWFSWPVYKLYMLAIARLEQEGILPTAKNVQTLVGLSYQVVSRTLRKMTGHLNGYYADKITIIPDDQWPLGRIKRGRSYVYYIMEPATDEAT